MRSRALLLGLVALLGAVACSDAADDAEGDASSESTVPGGVCEHLDPDALALALEVDLDEAEADGSTCMLSSSTHPATVGLSVTSLRSAPGDQALDLLSDSCDEGTAADLVVAGASGAFRCRVDGEITVAGVGGGQLAVVVGVSLGDAVPEGDAARALGAAVSGALH